MVLPMNQQSSRRSSSSSSSSSGKSVFSKRSSSSLTGRAQTTTSSACGGVGEVLVEISTPGARSPIHFIEGSAPTSCRGRSRPTGGNAATGSAGCFLSSTLLSDKGGSAPPTPPPFSSSSSSTSGRSVFSSSPVKHHRRTSSSLDGVCLTLLGVSTGLKTPGVDAWAVARALVESSVDLRTRNVRGMTPLHLACSAGQVDVARVLLLAGADSHARDHRSRCPLHMAALSGSSELVTSLLACGANPNKASDIGTTPLHNAALLGRVEVSRALLLAGADANATDHNSFSPLYLASQNGHTQLVLDLIAAGADASVKTNRGFTAMHVAARCGRLSVLKALLDAGEAVDSLSSPAETTPLHLSAGFSRLSCVEELLRRGADPSRENKRGATPLDMVGTLIIPVGAASSQEGSSGGGGDGGNSSSEAGLADARKAFEKKLAQGDRVKVVLERAQRWQRRRGVVLVWEALRRRAVAVSAAAVAADSDRHAPHGAVGVGERQPRLDDSRSSKRCCRHLLTEGVAAASCPSVEGWVVARLCTHADPALMKSVLGFL